MSTQAPVVTPPNDETRLNIGGSQIVRKIRSDDTNGAFSVVEFVSEPGEGVGLHTHTTTRMNSSTARGRDRSHAR